VPNHPVTFALLSAVELPIAAPSANRSGEVSPTTAQHVARSLGDRVPLILDAGPTDIGIESTVVDVSGGNATLLRPGVISSEQLAEVIGPLKTFSTARPDAALPSPGMLDRHYAPKTPLRLFETAERGAVEAEIRQAKARGKRVGVMAWSKEVNGADPLIILPSSPLASARILYSVLHRLDDEGCDLILVERPPGEPRWAAIKDRLERAAPAAVDEGCDRTDGDGVSGRARITLIPTVGLCRSEIRAQTKTPDHHRPGVFLSPENQD
jgi:L-threonylcarbamoyladenylate synthase